MENLKVAEKLVEIAEAFNPYDFDLILEESGLTMETLKDHILSVIESGVEEKIMEYVNFLQEECVDEEDEDYCSVAIEMIETLKKAIK